MATPSYVVFLLPCSSSSVPANALEQAVFCDYPKSNMDWFLLYWGHHIVGFFSNGGTVKMYWGFK